MEAHTLPAAKFPAFPATSRRKFASFSIPSNPISKPFTSKVSTSKTHLKSQQNDGIYSNGSSNRMFILGMGYVAQFFAQQLKNDGWHVSGTCTSIVKKKELEQKGFDIHVFDACQPDWKILDILRCYTHLLISIPPAENIGDPMLQHKEHLKTRLGDGNLRWLCYLSSTSVYGDSKGEWVDEDYPPMPLNNLGKLRLNAEEGWLKLGHDLSLTSYVFRLGGIYGPSRSAIDTILKKEPLSKGQKRRATKTFTSRIHVADICQALRASLHMRFPRKIYNIVDDDPASRAEVFTFARKLIEKRWPNLIDQTAFSTDTSLTGGGQKRVSNARVKEELGVSLLHTSYRSGLQSIIDQIEDPDSDYGSTNK